MTSTQSFEVLLKGLNANGTNGNGPILQEENSEHCCTCMSKSPRRETKGVDF